MHKFGIILNGVEKSSENIENCFSNLCSEVPWEYPPMSVVDNDYRRKPDTEV